MNNSFTPGSSPTQLMSSSTPLPPRQGYTSRSPLAIFGLAFILFILALLLSGSTFAQTGITAHGLKPGPPTGTPARHARANAIQHHAPRTQPQATSPA